MNKILDFIMYISVFGNGILCLLKNDNDLTIISFGISYLIIQRSMEV